jgi:hypothetical protein
MFYDNEQSIFCIPGCLTFASEITRFLWWDIEKQTYPKRKTTIKLRRKA